MGSGWGLNGNSDPSGSTPRTEEVSAIHWFAASGSPRRRQRRHRRLARAAQREVRGTTGAMVNDREPDERADGPEPGHLMKEASSEETEGQASARTASGRDPEHR
jgi:hypothetical protein